METGPSNRNQNQTGFELKILRAHRPTSTVLITNSNPGRIAGHHRPCGVCTALCDNACTPYFYCNWGRGGGVTKIGDGEADSSSCPHHYVLQWFAD